MNASYQCRREHFGFLRFTVFMAAKDSNKISVVQTLLKIAIVVSVDCDRGRDGSRSRWLEIADSISLPRCWSIP